MGLSCSLSAQPGQPPTIKASVDLLQLSALKAESRTFAGQVRLARVLNIVDGNTIDVATRLKKGEDTAKYRVRIIGIAVPRSVGCTEPERLAGQKAREALSRILLLGTIVYIQFQGEDREGKEKGWVYTTIKGRGSRYTRAEDVATIMLEHGYAKAYSGKGTAPAWSPHEWAHIANKNLSELEPKREGLVAATPYV